MSEGEPRRVGKYEILGEIGQGGFATVYKARDTTLERTVALKVLRRELLHDPVFVERFKAEAKMAAQLEHPNIVPIYEVGEYQGIHFLAMQYIEGQTLAGVLQVRGQLTVQQALKIVQDVAAALDEAHRKGMIHRDIKPSNILIRNEGTVLLSDFGLAKAADASFAASLTSTGQIMGTLRYMSPEQAEQKPVDHHADLYSLGIVLYEMLAGRPPFVGETAIQMIRAHADTPPPPPSQFNKAITPAIESVILRSLAKDPERRHPSAGQMARALERAITVGAVEKMPVPPEKRSEPEPKPEPKPKRLRWPVVLAGLAVVLCVLAAGSVWLLRDVVWPAPTPTVLVQATEAIEEPAPTWTSMPPTDTATLMPTSTPTATDTSEPSWTAMPEATDTPTPTATASPAAEPPTPSPVVENELWDGKAVGDSYEASGISLALMSYDIRSDGKVWLKFTVANQGNAKVLLRYQNNYFSVCDDTGKIYPQTERNLVDAKQTELAAGDTYEISSDEYPDSYREVGYFNGMVPEQANYLVVEVSQFDDVQDAQWIIPLNAQQASPQMPAPGTQQPPLEGFSANGIMVLMPDYSISSDGRIWFKFVIRNEGNNAVLLRYQDKYFEVYDDLGNRYEQEQRNLVDAKQVLLSPGDSYEMESDSYPDSYREIGYFYGMVPEQASYLILRISQFVDLRDAQWIIPLNPQLASPQTPAPGTLQPPLEGFSANGIMVLMSDYSISSDGRIWLKFVIRNEGSNAVLLRYQDKYFEVYDDLGNQYDQEQRNLLDAKQVLLSPGDSYEMESDSYPDSYREIGYFYGMVPEQASYIVVKVSQFANLQDMQWRIPLD